MGFFLNILKPVFSLSVIFSLALLCGLNAQTESRFYYIDTAFENASPLFWEIDSTGNININLIYDQERESINRASIHWHFQIQAQTGSELTLILKNFDNVWNGRKGSPLQDTTTCYISEDGKKWDVILGEKQPDNTLKVKITMPAPFLYVARLEPYRLGDLNKLLSEIRSHPLIKITTAGKTVEGRELEIIQVGRESAPFRVFLRARAHSWEPGGNWVVQGLIRNLLTDDPRNEEYLNTYCLYIMPMANKDGVARGLTRFNMNGMDLNRKWDAPADAELAPENAALEKWLTEMIEKNQKPHLAIDLHNDSGGKLHISRPEINLEKYLDNMKKFEYHLRRHTWFTEGSTGGSFRNPGSIGEGLLERFGIDAFVYELNANWIAGLQKRPFGKDWELLGNQLREVFYRYFTDE